MQQQNQSEVARLKREIASQSDAARLAMYGPLKGAAKHSFITKRMENMGRLHSELMLYIDSDEATKYLIETMEGGTKTTQNRKAAIQEHAIPEQASLSSQNEVHTSHVQCC